MLCTFTHRCSHFKCFASSHLVHFPSSRECSLVIWFKSTHLVGRVHFQSQVGGEHDGRVFFTWGSWASGTSLAAALSLGTHWVAPAGDLVCSQSYLNKYSKYAWSHCAGFAVQAPSRPEVMVCAPVQAVLAKCDVARNESACAHVVGI